MKKIEEVAVIIQARLSSERAPKKMTRQFAGSSLTEIAIRKILDSKIIPKENFYLSVHEQELVDIGERCGVNVFLRSEKSAKYDGGFGSSLGDMYEWWDKIPFKYVILVNACVPFLKTKTIDSFFEQYLNTKSNGLFAVIEKKNYFWDGKGKFITPWPAGEQTLNTKTVDTTWEAAHCLYASRTDSIGHGVFMGDFQKPGDIELFPIAEKESFDVDYDWQFSAYEAMYRALEGE